MGIATLADGIRWQSVPFIINEIIHAGTARHEVAPEREFARGMHRAAFAMSFFSFVRR
jgi:hypothetical protein